MTIATAAGALRIPRQATKKGRVHTEYHNKARAVDAKYNAHPRDTPDPGPVRQRLQQFGWIRGLVVGAFGETSSDVKDLIGELATIGAERCWRDMGARSQLEARGLLKAMLRESFGIEAVRGHARLKLDRLGVMSGDAAAAAKRRHNARYGWWQRRHLRSRLQGFARERNGDSYGPRTP